MTYSAGEVLAFSPEHDSHGKRDDTYAFHPRAERFVELHGGTHHDFDNRRVMRDRAAFVLRTIRDVDTAGGRLVCCAFFCHGWSRGIQAGFDLRAAGGVHPRELAKALGAVSGKGLLVPLYCCSTADSPHDEPSGDGGFADILRDELCLAGITNCRVDAHVVKGHATFNPLTRRFEGPRPAKGGVDIYPKDSRALRVWRRWLRTDDNDLRYPWLDTAAIYRTVPRP